MADMQGLPAIRALALCGLALACGWAGSVQAATAPRDAAPVTGPVALSPATRVLMLAEDATAPAEPPPQPKPGELVIPGNALNAEPKEEGEKKCMTVCVRWGEECILINKGAGGMERKCRRTCQQLGEECL